MIVTEFLMSRRRYWLDSSDDRSSPTHCSCEQLPVSINQLIQSIQSVYLFSKTAQMDMHTMAVDTRQHTPTHTTHVPAARWSFVLNSSVIMRTVRPLSPASVITPTTNFSSGSPATVSTYYIGCCQLNESSIQSKRAQPQLPAARANCSAERQKLHH